MKQLFSLCVKTLILKMFLVTSVVANDVTGDFSNNYQDSTVDSNNTDETVTNNYNATGAGDKAPVMSSIAPTIMGGFRAMVLANTPCPVNDFITGKLLMGKNALLKYRENPSVYVVGYDDDKQFWDTLLKVGEDIESNEKSNEETTTSKLSLSDRFRTR